MTVQARLTVVGLFLIVAATLGIRVVAYSVPEISDRIPLKPYARSVNYADAVENALSGRGYVSNQDRVGRVVRAWLDSGARIPPAPADFDINRQDTFRPIVDERGYLLVEVALAKIAGEFQFSSVLHLQAILSGLAVLLVFFMTYRLWPGWMPWLFALVYAIHPLEILLSVTPDLPIWSVYASVVAAAIAMAHWNTERWSDWAQLVCAGAFLGLCVVIRAPTLGVVITALAAMLFVSVRANWLPVVLVACGGLLSIGGLSVIGSDTPVVGRSATFHTLLGGLAEFGHIENLQWQDTSIHKYIIARHDVELYTPEFNEAARTEYLNVVQNRPELLLIVPARRLLAFVFAYRPGKSTLVVVLLFAIFKIAAILGAIDWWRRITDPRARRRIMAFFAVSSATVAVHLLIVPLLEVYIASFFILLSFPIVSLGALLVRRAVQGRA